MTGQGEEGDNENIVKVDPLEYKEPERTDPLPKISYEKETFPKLKEGELSDVDKALKEKLESLVANIVANQDVPSSLASLKVEIQTSTSSLTAIPKPLKFLLPHLIELETAFANNPASPLFADILSVLSMVSANKKCLTYKLQGNVKDIESWGPEYVRALAGELIVAQDLDPEVLSSMVKIILPYQLQHQMEYDAVDLCLDTELLPELVLLATHETGFRMAHYLVRISDYSDRSASLRAAFDMFNKLEAYFDSLRVALRMNQKEWMKEVFALAQSSSTMLRKQLSVLMASHRQFWFVEEAEFPQLVANSKLSDLFRRVGRELNVEEAKSPQDVYKSSLSESGGGLSIMRRETAGGGNERMESARGNLANVFCNGFVNCAFQRDELILPEGNPFVYRNKDNAMISAVASMGLLLLWDVDEGMAQIDRFLYSTDRNIKAGALLALGMVGCGVLDECEPALGMLPSHLVDFKSFPEERMCASLGLGLAYTNCAKEEVSEALCPVVESDTDFDSAMLAALSLGLVFCGRGDSSHSEQLVLKLSTLTEAESKHASVKFLVLGLAFMFLQVQEECQAVVELVSTIAYEPLAKAAKIMILSCAYAGSGDTEVIQQLLHDCVSTTTTTPPAAAAASDGAAATPVEEEDRGVLAHDQLLYQSFAVLGISLVSMGESIGQGMAHRMYTHLLQYGDVGIRRAIPLALALSYASNPEYNTVDVLNRMTHDVDAETAWCAILSLGLVGAGTNNSRIAGMLRLLATYYGKDANSLFIVRIAQGWLHMGKGLITLAPFHSDNALLLQSSVCGLLTILVASLDMKQSLLGKLHFLLFSLVPAMRPRMVICCEVEDMQPLAQVSLKVGLAVDIVGQAGKPKTITGFQTHVSPSLLSAGERCEFAEPEQFICEARVLEGVIFVERVPQEVAASTEEAEL